MVVIRKNISHEKGDKLLFDEIRYFFYITNDRAATAAEIVFGCNDRCDQENLIAQLAGGVRALSAPVDSLVSNWAYMVMTSLAWTLKAWSALLLPITPRHREAHDSRAHDVAADGVQNVRQRSAESSLPDRAPGPPRDLSRAALEPATPDVLPPGGRVELLNADRASREIAATRAAFPDEHSAPPDHHLTGSKNQKSRPETTLAAPPAPPPSTATLAVRTETRYKHRLDGRLFKD